MFSAKRFQVGEISSTRAVLHHSFLPTIIRNVKEYEKQIIEKKKMYIRTLRNKIMNIIKGENIRCIWKGSLSAHPKLKIEFEFIDPKIPPKKKKKRG